VGLASLVVYPTMTDLRHAVPNVDPSLVGDDMAYPIMLRFLPVGWLGLMLGGLIAANSSTILTHLNWGASYLVHDFYRRFVKRGAPDKHYVAAGRVATVLLFVASSAMVFALDTARESFNIILQVGAGTGLLYLVRWFWWRVTAWCEIVAMVSSFGVSILLLTLGKSGIGFGTSGNLLITVACTTVCWLAMAWFGPRTDPAVLVAFYKKVRPFGPGWRPIQELAGISAAEAAIDAEGANFPLAMAGWSSGVAMIWSALFMVGNFLYGRMGYAAALALVFAVSAAVLIRVVHKLWR
jgi:Na+/proline symporter